MNLKLNNNEIPTNYIKTRNSITIKEERQRTGRYIAILVGILLFLLAIYHAVVRRIPFIASLVVPAIIMFVYVGWVLYTASRDKHRLLDAELALAAAQEERISMSIANPGIRDDSPRSSMHGHIIEIPNNTKEHKVERNQKLIKPIILINDELLEDYDPVMYSQDFKSENKNLIACKLFPPRRKYKRKFCRSRRYTFKRSYSIG